MKNRLVALFCAILFLLLSFTACSDKKSEVVFSYGDASINENLYFYELAMMKTQMLQEYSGATTDIPTLWSYSMGEGITYDDWAYAQCQLNISTVLYFADYALQHGGELTREEKKQIEASAQEIVDEFGSKASLNKYLEAYNINYDMYLEYLQLYALYNKGISLAYGVGGERRISDSEILDYYKKNFRTVKHIAIGTEFAGTDKDGNYIYYTEDEKVQKKELIESITKALENGESFDELLKHGEDGFSRTYPNGYTIAKGVLGDSMQGYENVVFGLAEGEWDTFELEGTSFYFIKRVPLLESDIENCASTIMQALIQEDMSGAAVENYENLYMNQDIIDRYNMAMIPVLN